MIITTKTITTTYQTDQSKSQKTITKFMIKSKTAKIIEKYTCHFGRAKTPITFSLAPNLMRGIRAKGSWTDWRMFSQVSIPVNSSGFKKITAIAGTMATDLVRSTLFQTGS